MSKRINIDDLHKNSAIMTYINDELNMKKEPYKDRALEHVTMAFGASIAILFIYLFLSIR